MKKVFSVIALGFCLSVTAQAETNKVDVKSKVIAHTFLSYAPLMLWILLDSNLFETLSRHTGLNIWSHYTNIIILFHIIGLLAAYFLNIKKIKNIYLYHHYFLQVICCII